MFILAISPFARPQGEMRPCGVSAAGQKKGIFGLDRAKAGQRHVHFDTLRRLIVSVSMRRVSAEPIDVKSLPMRISVSRIPRQDATVLMPLG
jgi:hypothetical protein